jgi:precorrin-2 dehydrogenase/sirohydrochlorin ferrochelatase
MLNLRGRKVVVVGGGAVGVRKARSLAGAGAEITIVTGAEAPEESGAGRGQGTAAPPADERAVPGAKVVRADYSPEQLAGATLVIACTDDERVNRAVAADARRAGALVNVADCPELCDFYLPAVHTDGEVVVAVGTGGAAPSLAAKLRDDIAAVLPPDTGAFAAALAEVRRDLPRRVETVAARREIMRKLSGEQGRAVFAAKGAAALAEFADILMSKTLS